MLKNALSALYLFKGWTDFNQTCTDISLGDGQEILVTLTKIIGVIGGQRWLENRYIFWRWKITDQVLVTLTSFSKSQEVKEY